MYSFCGNSLAVPSKKLNLELPYDSEILLLGLYAEELKIGNQTQLAYACS